MRAAEDYTGFETDYFLEAIYLRYGYDFRNYSRASLNRRIRSRMELSGMDHISQMVPAILYEPEFFETFLNDMSITVTEMFRDPRVFKAFRDEVIPKLKTYPRLKIWHVGCATGEEAYSSAILLHEAGLLERSQIYATDYNKHSLQVAQSGNYSLKQMQASAKSYLNAGGQGQLSDYYRANYDSVRMESFLTDRINFAHHNLMNDRAFAEMNVIFCRNVLIYFNSAMRDSVLSLLSESLVQRGFLILGNKENIEHSETAGNLSDFCSREKIYRNKLSYHANV